MIGDLHQDEVSVAQQGYMDIRPGVGGVWRLRNVFMPAVSADGEVVVRRTNGSLTADVESVKAGTTGFANCPWFVTNSIWIRVYNLGSGAKVLGYDAVEIHAVN